MWLESVPLRDVHSAFHWFAKVKYFTTLDLNQAYHQIPLAKTSKPLTVFCPDWYLYQYARVTSGLATGAQVLSRVLCRVIQDIKFEFVYHYLDDVIYRENIEKDLQNIGLALDRVRHSRLTVKPQKVDFATHWDLGHFVSKGCVRIDLERARPIREFPIPQDTTLLARFIGMFNIYHKSIARFPVIAATLNALRRKGMRFVWG